MTALSRSWGFCLFGSFNWARTASRALGSGPFRMKCSKILRARWKKTEVKPTSTLHCTSLIVSLLLQRCLLPRCSQCHRSTHVVVLGHAHGQLHFLQHLGSARVHGHHRSQLGDSVHLTVHVTAWLKNTHKLQQACRGFLCTHDLQYLPDSSLPASTFLMKAFRLPFLHGPSIGRMALGPNKCNKKLSYKRKLKLCYLKVSAS